MKSSTLIQIEAGAVAVVLCTVLSGCAVLTVDVDVYKGALVNEEHVQLHQLVALTTAAQPMLVNLRDDLEWPETDGAPPKALVSGCPKTWYQKGYVRVPETWVPETSVSWWQDIREWWRSDEWFPHRKCQPYFRHAYSRVVNDILGLYEDLADPDLALHGRKLREAAERLPWARPDVMGDQASYEKIAAGFKADSDLTPELRLLKEGYRELLVVSPVVLPEGGPGRKVGKLMDALKARAGTGVKGKGLEADLIAEWKGTNAYKEANTIYDRRLPFRAVWKLLGEGLPDTLLTQATLELCQKNLTGDSACATLLARTKELADEYWAARRAVRELWEEGVALLIDIERLQRETPDRYRGLKEEVIRLIVKLTNVRHIASALDRLDSEGRCAILSKELARGVMCEVDPKGARVWTEQNVRGKSEAFDLALQRSLSSTTADTAHVLLLLDSLEKTAPPNQGLASHLVKKANTGNNDRAVRLGLIRSAIDDPELQDAQEVVAIVSGVSRKLGQGLERGRMSDGLYTLIEAFLKSHNGHQEPRDSHDVTKLLDAVVEFAQKVLFLANHEGLASPPETSGLILGGAEKLTRGLFGDAAVGGTSKKSFILGTARVPEARKQQYVRVLQAVGNTILYSANELRERERYQDLSKDKVRAEVAAVKEVYSPDPQKILDDLIGELRREQVIAQNQLGEATAQKAAIDGQIGGMLPTKTGLRQDEETALNERNKAGQDLQNYVTKQGPLKAIHDVLTQEVIAKIKAQWKVAGTGAAADVTAFMTGSHGMEQELTNIRQALDGIPTTVETHNFDEGAKYVNSSEARAAFEAYRTINGHTSLAQVELLDAFAAHLRELEAARVARVMQYEKNMKEKEQAVLTVQEKIAKMETESLRLAAVITSLPNTKLQLSTALTVIEALKAEVLKEAVQNDRFVSPNALYLLLATHVKRKEDAEADATKKQPYLVALDVLSHRIAPPGLPPLDPKNYNSPLAVMDDVIALLRHRQMMAVERFGKGSDEVKKATEALENTYQHRAGMVYTRPSSAYLRTSFPSTSLQDDPNLAWDNMLLKQGIRNLPFSRKAQRRGEQPEQFMGIDSGTLGTAALAIGALGTASYGVVDGLKLVSWIDLAGFERIFAVGGKEGGRRFFPTHRATLDPFLPALRIAYGSDVMELLRAQYRAGRASGDLLRTLRQGVRIGFGMMAAEDITSVAVKLGIKQEVATLAAEAIDRARRQRADASPSEQSRSLDEPGSLSEPAMTDEQRSAMARLETMIDARIDAALALADRQYVTQTKLLAMLVSLAISFLVGWFIGMEGDCVAADTLVTCAAKVPAKWTWCLIVGLAAVPLAPVAKDLSTALQEAAKALKAR